MKEMERSFALPHGLHCTLKCSVDEDFETIEGISVAWKPALPTEVLTDETMKQEVRVEYEKQRDLFLNEAAALVGMELVSEGMVLGFRPKGSSA